MICGIGSDLVDIRRIEATLTRFGDRFTHRIFTEAERHKCDPRAARAAGYARRFAAKEACAKALGTGFREGIWWRDLEVINLPGGQPSMRLFGGALDRLMSMMPAGSVPQIDASLTDEPPMAQAIVIISAVERPRAGPA